MSSHRSQESDKLGKKLYCASRAAKSIKVMPSAYININGSHIHANTHTHTHTGQGKKDMLVGSLSLLPHSEKRKDKKIPHRYLKYSA